jgi:hypothetical protein
MKISKPQLERLKRWLQFRGRPYPIHQMVLASWPGYTIMIVALGGLSGYLWWRGAHIYAVGLGCYLLGLLYRDFLWLRQRSKYWPVVDHITDWKRAEELVRENESGAT